MLTKPKNNMSGVFNNAYLYKTSPERKTLDNFCNNRSFLEDFLIACINFGIIYSNNTKKYFFLPIKHLQ